MDKSKAERKYTESYALSTPAGVKKLLRDRHHIAARRYRGDTAASDIIIDLHSAMNSAGLTDRQTEAVAWVYGVDVTQAVAAEIMGISQKNVSEYIDIAAGRIADVYKRWNYGEITVEFTEVNESEVVA